MGEMTEEEQERRRCFMEDLNASFLALQKNPEAWKAYQDELRLWDVTLADGLPQDEIWGDETRTAWIVPLPDKS
ncbi:MAG TPA: hypothetical protein VF789_32530 [Thermoanaerobaculia bacterium]